MVFGFCKFRGHVAQLCKLLVDQQKVVGSIPSLSEIFFSDSITLKKALQIQKYILRSQEPIHSFFWKLACGPETEF